MWRKKVLGITDRWAVLHFLMQAKKNMASFLRWSWSIILLEFHELARRKRPVRLSQYHRQWGALGIWVLSSSILSGLMGVSTCYQVPSHKRVHPSKQDRLCGCHHKNTQVVLIPRKPGVSFYTPSLRVFCRVETVWIHLLCAGRTRMSVSAPFDEAASFTCFFKSSLNHPFIWQSHLSYVRQSHETAYAKLIKYSCPWVSLGIDPQLHGCSITLHKMVRCMHMTYTHLPTDLNHL